MHYEQCNHRAIHLDADQMDACERLAALGPMQCNCRAVHPDADQMDDAHERLDALGPSANEMQQQREREEEGEDMHESSPDSKLLGRFGERPELRNTTLQQTDKSTKTSALPTAAATAKKPAKIRDASHMPGIPGAHPVPGIVTENLDESSLLSSGDSVLPDGHRVPTEDWEESPPSPENDSVPDGRRIEKGTNLISATLVDEAKETEIMNVLRKMQADLDQVKRQQNEQTEKRTRKKWFSRFRGLFQPRLLRKTTTDAVQ